MSEEVERRMLLKVPQTEEGRWDFDSVEWFRMEWVRHLDFMVELEVAVPDGRSG